MTIACRLLISGRVQGVCYRDWAVAAAAELGVAGWVRNLADGRVEAFAEGGAEAISAFVDRCRTGPSNARVSDVTRVEAKPEGAANFRRRADA